MASNSGSTTKSRSTSKANGQAQRKQAKPADRAVTYVRQSGERAVDVPVGAVLTARDRISGTVQPWARSQSRARELRDLRRQVSTELGRFERRGGEARRRATERVGQSLRKAQTSVQQRVSSLA